MINGDSGEYEFLTEAVSLTWNVEGICAEVGVRKGLGTKTIIDAVKDWSPSKTVIGIDPYGSILYVGREHIGAIRLDYDNAMRDEAIADLVAYAHQQDVNWLPFIMTDEWFFHTMYDGVEVNQLETTIVNKYSMVHLDGPHYVEAVQKEIRWFNDRMDANAIIVIDDITPDFIDIAPIDELFDQLGWEVAKKGIKKGMWRKK